MHAFEVMSSQDASQVETSSQPPTFYPFPRLPIELQRAIWAAAFTSLPHYLKLSAKHSAKCRPHSATTYGCGHNSFWFPGWEAADHATYKFPGVDHFLNDIRAIVQRNPIKVSEVSGLVPLLRSCCLAREVVLECWRAALRDFDLGLWLGRYGDEIGAIEVQLKLLVRKESDQKV